MDVEVKGHPGAVAAVAQVGEQRGLQPLAGPWRQRGQWPEAQPRQVVDQRRVLGEQELQQMVVGGPESGRLGVEEAPKPAGARPAARRMLDGQRRAERCGMAAERELELLAAAGAVGVGHDEARGAVDAADEDIARQPPVAEAAVVGPQRHDRHGSRQRPRGVGRSALENGTLRCRIGDQRRHELGTPALVLARRRGLRGDEALDRDRRDLVEVGKQRVGQDRHRLGLGARVGSHSGDPTPDHARAEVIARLEVIEAVAGAIPALSDRDVQRTIGAEGRRPMLDDAREVVQRIGDRGDDIAAERPIQSSIDGDRRAEHLDQLIGNRRDRRADERAEIGRQGVPGPRAAARVERHGPCSPAALRKARNLHLLSGRVRPELREGHRTRPAHAVSRCRVGGPSAAASSPPP
jgi:hypothetical protein